LPLPPDAILIPVPGGQLVIDGVQVVSRSEVIAKLSVGGTYLLVLEPRGESIRVAALRGGSAGVFAVHGDSFVPLSNQPYNPVVMDIANAAHHSLRELKQALEKRRSK
jgi:hypothetical protein